MKEIKNLTELQEFIKDYEELKKLIKDYTNIMKQIVIMDLQIDNLKIVKS